MRTSVARRQVRVQWAGVWRSGVLPRPLGAPLGASVRRRFPMREGDGGCGSSDDGIQGGGGDVIVHGAHGPTRRTAWRTSWRGRRGSIDPPPCRTPSAPWCAGAAGRPWPTPRSPRVVRRSASSPPRPRSAGAAFQFSVGSGTTVRTQPTPGHTEGQGRRERTLSWRYVPASPHRLTGALPSLRRAGCAQQRSRGGCCARAHASRG